jgi:hypothetical protein
MSAWELARDLAAGTGLIVLVWRRPEMRLFVGSILVALAGVAAVVALVAWSRQSFALLGIGVALGAAGAGLILLGLHADRRATPG